MTAPPVLAHDAEAPPERRVDAELDHGVERGHRGVDDHLVAGADVGDLLAHRVDDAGHVAARHVGKVRAGQPAGDPEVHVVEGRRHRADTHVVGPHGWVLDLALAVAAG